jgi:hypothetical protein
MEIWKNIKEFEGVYMVSSFGNLKSFKKDKNGRVLKNTNKKGGYFSIVLQYKDNVRYCRMHRLVAEAFIPNPCNKKQVNHIDGNKQNNNVLNLEWATPKENIQHAIKMNPNILKGMNNYNTDIKPKTIIQLSIEGEEISRFKNSTEAQKKTGVCARNILQVASKDEYKKGKTRSQAGGYKWKYQTV